MPVAEREYMHDTGYEEATAVYAEEPRPRRVWQAWWALPAFIVGFAIPGVLGVIFLIWLVLVLATYFLQWLDRVTIEGGG